ncbi:hypothetical protein Tco_0854704 [Tanacetum coccineum]
MTYLTSAPRAASSARDAQGSPTQSAAHSQCTASVQGTASFHSTANSQGTAKIQGTDDFQGTAEPHDAASIPKSPNDYTPTDASQTSGGDEGLLDVYALNREVKRLKRQTLLNAKLIQTQLFQEEDTSTILSLMIIADQDAAVPPDLARQMSETEEDTGLSLIDRIYITYIRVIDDYYEHILQPDSVRCIWVSKTINWETLNQVIMTSGRTRRMGNHKMEMLVNMEWKFEDESDTANTLMTSAHLMTDAEQRRPTIKKLEVKQVEFKLGEDCWEIQVKRSKFCHEKVKVLLNEKVKVLPVKDRSTAVDIGTIKFKRLF